MKSHFLVTNTFSHVPSNNLRFSRHSTPSPSLIATSQPQLSVFENLACGAIGRAIQIFAMFPLDTIKTRVQVSRAGAINSGTPASTGMISPLTLMASAMQKGNLYKGVAFSLLGQIPYGMLTFGMYETLLSHAPKEYPQWLRVMISAAIGDAIGSLWLTPSEVIKSKTQVGVYSSPIAAVNSLSKEGLPAFYQGYSAAIARDIPFRAIQFVLFDRIKTWYMNDVKKQKNVSAIENLLIGALAGTLTGAVTIPLDVTRTRMMSQAIGDAAMYKNAIDCVVKTISTEGVSAMFKGIVPRCLLLGPSSAVFFLAYETSKNFFRNRARSGIGRKRSVQRIANQATCGRRRYHPA